MVAPPPLPVVSAPQPRLLYRRSEPVHLERWCESAGDALLARDQGKVVVVRADGTVKQTELEGFPCQTDRELVSFHLKGKSVVLSRLASDGAIYQLGIPPPFGCIVRGDEATLLRTDNCPATGAACGSIERVILSTGASESLVPFGRNVALHAAWTGSELIWTGLFESAFGVWISSAGTTKKLSDSPAPQTMCCELAASKDVVLLAEQRRLVRLDRASGLMHRCSTDTRTFARWCSKTQSTRSSPTARGSRRWR